MTRARRSLPGLLLALAGLAAHAPPARAEDTGEGAPGKRYRRVHVIDFEGEIEPALTAYTERRIEEAEAAGADLIVFRIESPGGMVGPTRDLAHRILRVKAGIRTLAWVPEYAYSGAAIVAISCDEIAMAPRSYLGDAQPGTISPEGWRPVGEKAETVLRALVRSFAEDNGYPSLLAEKLISENMEVLLLEGPDGDRRFVLGDDWRDAGDGDPIGNRPKSEWRRARTFPKGQLLTMTAEEAKDLGFAGRLVEKEEALLEGLSAPGAAVVQHRMTASERAGRWLLGFAGVLVALMLLGVSLTVFQGIGTHSFIAAGALFLFVLVLATADLAQGFPIFLVVLGVVLLGLEAFVFPGFGIPGLLGIASFVGGLLFLATGFRPGDPATFDGGSIERFGIQLLLTVLVAGTMLVLLTRVFPSTPFGRRRLVLEGALPTGAASPAPNAADAAGEGVAVTPLRPAGTARVRGSLVDVVTEGDFVDAGARVRVVRVEGNRVVVRPVAG